MAAAAERAIPVPAAAEAAYGSVSKWFHWTTAALVAVALPVGFVIGHVKDSDKMPFYAVHESAGVTIFLVVLARLAWRLAHPAPPLPPHVPALQRRLASAVHHLLYALLIVQPLIGFLATNAYGFPLRGQTAYLGIVNLPKFMETNEALGGALLVLHGIGGWSLLVLLALHVGGVVWHQAIRRDGLLLRMV